MEQQTTKKLHSLMLDNRKKVVLSGVEQIKYSSETEMAIITGCGEMIVVGAEMHVIKFNKEDGTLGIEGKIDAVCYSDAQVKKGMLKRIFK